MVNEMDSMSVFVDFLNTHTSPHAKIAALTHVLCYIWWENKPLQYAHSCVSVFHFFVSRSFFAL